MKPGKRTRSSVRCRVDLPRSENRFDRFQVLIHLHLHVYPEAEAEAERCSWIVSLRLQVVGFNVCRRLDGDVRCVDKMSDLLCQVGFLSCVSRVACSVPSLLSRVVGIEKRTRGAFVESRV